MKQFPLLPSRFKWIALALILSSVLLSFALKDYLQDYRVEASTISINIINLGLLMYFFSRRKEDDEMLALMRLKTLAGGVLLLIISIFIEAIWNCIEPDAFEENTAGAVMKIMIFINLMYEVEYRKIKNSFDAE
ncbi:hypothetical protein [Myroides fluvii]|uniref:hypothetical protein n=1 Tax=Myroides fluvii TaxID=2572594 RepID=UPI00131E8FAE|nr:hypothetical protein [Myroides fluvii]